MRTLHFNSTAVVVMAIIIAPATLHAARADDDWDDRWEDYEEAIEEEREEAEEAWEELRDDGVIVRYPGWHGYYGPGGAYRVHRRPGVRYYRYYDGPVYHRRYWGRPRIYRGYGPRAYGEVHAGPADVYYGRHGSVHVGPIHVHW